MINILTFVTFLTFVYGGGGHKTSFLFLKSKLLHNMVKIIKISQKKTGLMEYMGLGSYSIKFNIFSTQSYMIHTI